MMSVERNMYTSSSVARRALTDDYVDVLTDNCISLPVRVSTDVIVLRTIIANGHGAANITLSAPYSRNKTTLVTNTNQPPVEPYYKVNKVDYMCAYSVTEVVSLENNVKMRFQVKE